MQQCSAVEIKVLTEIEHRLMALKTKLTLRKYIYICESIRFKSCSVAEVSQVVTGREKMCTKEIYNELRHDFWGGESQERPTKDRAQEIMKRSTSVKISRRSKPELKLKVNKKAIVTVQ